MQEQIAADVLFPDEPKLIAALGFLAAGPWDESSLRDIREDTIDREVGRYLDRDDMVTTVMSTFASLTVHCARCHDHKFDPIPQEEYYRLQAVFAGVGRGDVPSTPTRATAQKRNDLQAKLAALDKQRCRDHTLLDSPSSRKAVAAWEARHRAAGVDVDSARRSRSPRATDGATLDASSPTARSARREAAGEDTYTLDGARRSRRASPRCGSKCSPTTRCRTRAPAGRTTATCT